MIEYSKINCGSQPIASRAIEKSTNTEGSKIHCFPHTLL